MTSPSIHLFSHVDDVWEDDVRAWLEVGTKTALSGQKVWMVCRSFLQANWLRRRPLGEGKPIVGVRFLDLRRLRQELCLRAGLPTPAFGRETLSLLLRARMAETEASSAFAGEILDGLVDLAPAQPSIFSAFHLGSATPLSRLSVHCSGGRESIAH